ncbi:MAG: N-acetyltransferase [bacterium]
MIRKAKMKDVPIVHELVNDYASRGEMLARSRSEIYEGLRDFFIAEEEGQILGCAALHINWEDLAEVRSLAVSETAQKRGIGRKLVEACIQEARALGVAKVYALTYRPGFFEQLGFDQVPKETLPHKIWGDCLKCPQFPNCDEDAVMMEIAR